MTNDKSFIVTYVGGGVVRLGNAGVFQNGTSAHVGEEDAEAARAMGDFQVRAFGEGAVEPKPADKPAASASKKDDAKTEAKTEAKADAKTSGKAADAKPADKPAEAKADAKPDDDGKGSAPPASEGPK